MEDQDFIEIDGFDDKSTGQSPRRKKNLFNFIDNISKSLSEEKIERIKQVMPEVVNTGRQVADIITSNVKSYKEKMEDQNFIDLNEFDDKPAGESRRRKMNLFYLIDISGSMSGDKIESVNQVMPEAIQIVSEISADNKDNAEIAVSALLFSNGTQWLYPEAIDSEDFHWRNQEAWGGTDLGEACIELEKALHREGPKAQLKSTSGHKNPAIILLSDGEPTDNYELGLEKLKKNNWFKSASKVAFGIGKDYNIDNLVKFTGSKELVIEVDDVESLKGMIKMVSAIVSKVGSQSASAKSNGEQMTQNEEIEGMISAATEKYDGAATGNDIDSLPPTDMFD